MACLQERNGSFRAIFRHEGRQRSVTLGRVSQGEAEAKAGAIDLILLRIRQRLLAVPDGVTLEEFLLSDGRAQPLPAPHEGEQDPDEPVKLAEFKEQYLGARSGGSMEDNSLATARMHLNHFGRTLGKDFDLRGLTLADLQGHVNTRRKEGNPRRKKAGARVTSAATLRLEVSTLRAAWNWGVLSGLLKGPFPSKGLQYPKADERLPFMTWEEIERRLRAGGDAAELWHSLYFRKAEIENFLADVKERATAPWVYPMIATAAYTGARRSELLRMEVADVDFETATLLVREKKRSRKERTTRRVSMAPALAGLLREWLAAHPGGKFLFCQAGEVARSKKRSRTTGHKGGKTRPSGLNDRLATVRQRGAVQAGPVTRDEAHDHFKRTLAGSKWEVLKGYHVLCHSFISCLAAAGVDQRIIDEFVGHLSDEQRRRYRHLVPDVKQKAITSVFGG
jgi:integrase